MIRNTVLMWFLLPGCVFAQTEFGVKGGLNISDIVITNYINPDAESDFRLKLGLHAGFFVTGMVNERAGLAAELLYSNKGVKANSDIHLHYITLPLLVQYQLTGRLFAEIGPELAYMFSSTSKYGNVNNTYNQKFDLGLDAGFRLNTTKLVFGLRYCVGLFSVTEPVETIGTSGVEKIKYQNRVLQLSMGYKLYVLE